MIMSAIVCCNENHRPHKQRDCEHNVDAGGLYLILHQNVIPLSDEDIHYTVIYYYQNKVQSKGVERFKTSWKKIHQIPRAC